MSVLPQEARRIRLPRMIHVTQNFPDQHVEDVYACTRERLRGEPAARLEAGASVAVLVGSRGICRLAEVVKAAIDHLLEQGTRPYIVPSMGSHGGGVAEEQRKIIEGYGVTEEAMGVPIRSNMETVVIGVSGEGIPVHMDYEASQADYIVPIVRIKAHTDFDGPIESGYCKMLAIGLGKHNGCARVHREGLGNFATVIPSVASTVLERRRVPFGVGIIENAHEHVYAVHVTPGERFLDQEPELLALSKRLMPRLCFPHIDVLVVERIGKDITGAGMDPNITGRSALGVSSCFSGPAITNIVALSLTEGTHHNASGVGSADFITRALFDDIDLTATYTNCIAAGALRFCKIPAVLESEEEALRAAIHTCPRVDPDHVKMVRIQDTLHLVDIQVSESLVPYCEKEACFTVHR